MHVFKKMRTSNCFINSSLVALLLYSKWIASCAFLITSPRVHSFPPDFARNDIIRLDSTSYTDRENCANEQTANQDLYTIHLAQSRQDILGINLYRFGGLTVEDHMIANPELKSRGEALRSLTPTFDDSGKKKVYCGNGNFGESVLFFALAADTPSFFANEEDDKQYLHDSCVHNRRVVGSIEAVTEPAEDEMRVSKVSIELKNLSVHKEARRRGIGKALVAAVQDFARSQVYSLQKEHNEKVTGVVHLLVEIENKGAMHLYEESGFVGSVNPEDPICKLTWSIDDSSTNH